MTGSGLGAARLKRALAAFDGGPAAYLSLGGGDGGGARLPAVLLHGFAGDLLTWQYVLTPLAAGRRVVAVDLPGHGGSTLDVGDGCVDAFAPWLLRFLDALDAPRVHLIGHSMGGAVALEAARRAPGRVASLSLIASAGLGPGFDLAFLRRVTALASAEEGTACAAGLFAGPSPLAARIGTLLHAQSADPRRRAALERIVEGSFVPAAAGAPPPVDWAGLAMPVQLLWGRGDRIIPLPPRDRLPPAVPLHLFDKAGHLPHSEAAGPVTAALRAFLFSCESSTGPTP